jgi:hypothetical protein
MTHCDQVGVSYMVADSKISKHLNPMPVFIIMWIRPSAVQKERYLEGGDKTDIVMCLTRLL